jgi:hypothetical protein
MDVFLLTKHAALVRLFKSVLKAAAVLAFPDCSELLASVIEQSQHSRPAVVTIHLPAASDMPQFIRFLRLSSATAHIPIMAVGDVADFEALDEHTLADLNDHLLVPLSGVDLSAAVNTHDHPVPVPRPKVLRQPGGLRHLFTIPQLRKQITILRRKGLSLGDHAYALDTQPGTKDYAVLEKFWSEPPAL